MIGYNGVSYAMQFQGLEGYDGGIGSDAGSRAAAYGSCGTGTGGAYGTYGAGSPAGNYGGSQQNYQQNQVLTASPEQILIMLFDAAIRFCREAQKANEEGDTALKLEKIQRVFNIIAEFSNTLDHKVGGSIAEELDALYQFNLDELGRARRDSGNTHLKFVENFLLEWRGTWMEVIEINRNQANQVKNAQAAVSGGLAVAG